MTEETKQKLLSIEDDWKNCTVWDLVHNSFSEEETRISHIGKKINIAALFIEGGVGHVCINYTRFNADGAGEKDTVFTTLRANLEGCEPLYALVNSSRMHQYGNDDYYADDIGCFVIDRFCNNVDHKPTPAQGEYMPGVFSVTCDVMHGVNTPATPDIRKAFEPLSDRLGPVHTECCSHDLSSPTAIAKSAAKLDHSRFANGMILNWKFSHSVVSGDVGRENLMSLMDVYFQNNGMERQLSIIGRDTMLDAQKHPEQYQDLLVRIAGYYAYFVLLSKEVEDDLIGRTELSFD